MKTANKQLERLIDPSKNPTSGKRSTATEHTVRASLHTVNVDLQRALRCRQGSSETYKDALPSRMLSDGVPALSSKDYTKLTPEFIESLRSIIAKASKWLLKNANHFESIVSRA